MRVGVYKSSNTCKGRGGSNDTWRVGVGLTAPEGTGVGIRVLSPQLLRGCGLLRTTAVTTAHMGRLREVVMSLVIAMLNWVG